MILHLLQLHHQQRKLRLLFPPAFRLLPQQAFRLLPPTSVPITAEPTSKQPTVEPFPFLDPGLLPNTNAEFTNSDYTVGVYYYPWYGNKDFNGRNYLRAEISPPQLPTLGEYNQNDPAVIAQHLEWSREANVNLWVTSWWGPDSATDRVTRNVIMPHPDLPGTKIALFYESKGRIKTDVSNVYSDIDYACKTYFNDPNYLLIQGKPAFFIYLARDLQVAGLLDDAVREMRRAATDNGFDGIYLVGDVAHSNPPKNDVNNNGTPYVPFDLLDAATEYDPYGSMDRPTYAGVGKDAVDFYKTKQKAWSDGAHRQDCDFIPSVTPGYNDKGVRGGHNPLSRKLTPSSEFGSLFRALLKNAVNHVDDVTGKLIMVTSWNEWHEDTQIEPVGAAGSGGGGPVTSTPNDRTLGVEYEEYGTRYLDILREETNRVP